MMSEVLHNSLEPLNQSSVRGVSLGEYILLEEVRQPLYYVHEYKYLFFIKSI